MAESVRGFIDFYTLNPRVDETRMSLRSTKTLQPERP